MGYIPSASEISKEKNDSIFLTGGGKMGAYIRNHDWSKTPLGAIEGWPQSLRTTVSLCFASNFPINIIWGNNRCQIYNDGYWPICGDKHPTSMGQDFKECWFSAWPALGEAFDAASKGATRFLTNQRMFLDRFGYSEETFFTFSFSPIRDEAGNVVGLLHPVTDLTQQSLSERRLNVVHELSERSTDAKSVSEVCNIIIEVLSRHELDLPFILLYLLNEDGNKATLVGSTGLTSALVVSQVDLKQRDRKSLPISKVASSKKSQIVNDLETKFGAFSCAPYPEPPHVALVLPIIGSGVSRPLAILVAGVSSRRELDKQYKTFYNQLVVAVTNAITNARCYEEERKKALALTELDKAKTLFFSNISHEFRTPITLMLGPLEELMNAPKSNLNEKQRRSIGTSHRNAMRMLKLVNSLLDFSGIESGRQQASYSPVNLGLLTKNLASNFRSVIEKAGLQFTVKAESSKERVYVDKQMWEKIVFNLLSNAFKFTLHGSITLHLFYDETSANLTIKDSGVGISEMDLPKLFERFYRSHNVFGRTYEGTGIGLSLIKELVHLHGGNITVESKEGKGSTFMVKIPLKKSHLSKSQIDEGDHIGLDNIISNTYVNDASSLLDSDNSESRRSTSKTLNEATETVMVVDDNADMRHYLESLLDNRYHVITATNGLDALHKIIAIRPSLILSDIMMPKMDGIQLLKQIKQNPKTNDIPFVLITARAGEESKIEGYETGADDYLVKPFARKQLIARVNSLIHIAKIRRNAEKQLTNAFNLAPVPTAILMGLDFMVIQANTLMLELWGKTSDDVMNRPLFQGIPEATGQGFEVLLTKVFLTGERFVSKEHITNINRNGTIVQTILSFVYEPLREIDGTISGIIVVANDVTDMINARKMLEQEVAKQTEDLRRSNNELKKTNFELEQFAFVTSHHLQEPLRKIRTFVDLMTRNVDNKNELTKYMIKVESSTAKMSALILDLLNYSSLTFQSDIVLNIDLNEVLESVKTDFELLIQEKNAVINSDKLPNISGIRFQMVQLFSNLVGNALKFSGENPVIDVTYRPLLESEVKENPLLDNNKVYIKLVFADNGIGFQQIYAEQIFNIFSRLHTQESFSGTGIGLSICKKVVENHNGVLSAKAEPGKGATFTIILPQN